MHLYREVELLPLHPPKEGQCPPRTEELLGYARVSGEGHVPVEGDAPACCIAHQGKSDEGDLGLRQRGPQRPKGRRRAEEVTQAGGAQQRDLARRRGEALEKARRPRVVKVLLLTESNQRPSTGVPDQHRIVTPRLRSTADALPLSETTRTSTSPLARVLIAQGLSSLGTSVSTVALAVMVFDLTGSVLHMGAVLAASTLPVVVVAFLGGALLDRYGGRKLMVVADLSRAVLIALMPFAAHRSVFFIYAVSVAMGSFSALFNPGQVKLVGELASRGKLMRTNSYLSIAREGCELGGYLVGGFLVASLGYALTFTLDSVSYLASAVLLLTVAYRPRPLAPAPVAKLLKESPAAVAALWRAPVLRTNTLLALLPMTLILMITPNTYALALQVFDMGARGLGLMEVITSIGWVAGGVIASRMAWEGDRNTYVVVSIVAMSICFAAVSFSPWFWLSVGLLALATTANVGAIVGSMTLFQEIEERADKGRIISLRSGLGQLSATTGLLGGGLLGQLLGVRPLFLFVAVGASLLSGAILMSSWANRQERRRAGRPRSAATDILLDDDA